MNNTMTGITAIAPPAAIPVQSTVFSPLNAYSPTAKFWMMDYSMLIPMGA